MQVRQDNYDVGVIVARFQVPQLHEAHVDLIESVMRQHNKVLLFLGASEVKSTPENPLDIESRAQMVREHFPKLVGGYIKDEPTDEGWSDHLDELITDQLTPSQTAVIYGSRDSFARAYTGRYPTRELQQEVWISGTEIRQGIASSSAKSSVDWRRGAIWAAFNRYPTPFPTVDVAVYDDDGRVLMARKRNEQLYRFIGGFVQPGETWEQAAVRETSEETGLAIGELRYVASLPVDDWRYRGARDGITTTLFRAKLLYGAPTPGDDLKGGELRWFDTLARHQVVDTHGPLYDELFRSACQEA